MSCRERLQETQSALEEMEAGVEELVRLCERLREENRSLRKQLEATAAERAVLFEKNAQVTSRVEAMISRLKAME